MTAMRESLMRRILVAASLTIWMTSLVAEDKPAINLDERRAFGYLEDVCKLGPRPSESKGMTDQQNLLIAHFTNLGAQVRLQEFDTPHPKKGTPVRMKNLIVSWHPQVKERVLLCCHYDTRPYPDRDEFRPKGIFLGANDGGSGVALFMEMGHSLPAIKPTFGVDMVFFDGEEFIFQRDGGKFFLGSEHFAQQYRDRPPPYRYVCGVLVDMIGDKNLKIPIEPNSRKFAPNVVRSVWDTARTLGIKEFVSKSHLHEINDDHVPLNEIAKIPTADLIDFDYPHWHTTKDTPLQCSGASLVKVGRVLLTWLQQVPEDIAK